MAPIFRGPSVRSRAYAAIALVLGLVFLLVALDKGIYANTLHAPGVVRRVLHLMPFPVKEFFRDSQADTGWAPHLVVRKVYSLLAFSIVGFFVAKARSNRPARTYFVDAVFLTAAFSALIEILQHAGGSAESLRSNLFDVGCGALGGAFGALVQVSYRALRPRSPS